MHRIVVCPFVIFLCSFLTCLSKFIDVSIFFLTHTSSILLSLFCKASHLLVYAKMPRATNPSVDKLPCHCQKTLYDRNNQPMEQLYFAKCQVCKANYNLHDRCHLLLPGLNKHVFWKAVNCLQALFVMVASQRNALVERSIMEWSQKLLLQSAMLGLKRHIGSTHLTSVLIRLKQEEKVGNVEPAI